MVKTVLFSPSTNAKVSITCSWAKNLLTGAYLSIFHTIILWSSEHETIVLRSTEYTKYLTHPSCPLNVLLQYPVDIYHSFIVLSREQDIR